MPVETIRQNIAAIRETVAKTAKDWDRNGDDVKLIAVSKVQPDDRIDAALAAGHRLYGENRVQEAQQHWTHRKEQFPDVELHLIGPLQTNKAKDAVALFDCIQTVDRPKLAKELAKEMEKQNRHLPCFIQVNTGEEEQKAGILPSELDDFLTACRNDHKLNIIGLMAIPPVNEPAGMHFAMLSQMAQKHNLPELSIGMSGDYKKAIPCGATYIRVGTAVFGERDYT